VRGHSGVTQQRFEVVIKVGMRRVPRRVAVDDTGCLCGQTNREEEWGG